MKQFMSRHLDDVLMIGGAGAIVYGVALLSVAAAAITAGILMIAFGVLIGLGSARKGANQ